MPCTILVMLATFALISQPTYANSGPPPRRIWFVFVQGLAPTAVQIIGCGDAACSTINLLREYGRCESAECIDTPQTLTAPTDYFDCANSRCLLSTYADMPPYIKLIAQFADGDRSSAALPIDQNAHYTTNGLFFGSNGPGSELTSIPEGQLVGLDWPTVEMSGGRLSRIVPWMLPSGVLTIVIEVLVIALLLYWVVKLPLTALRSWVAVVVITNLLSYPATWLFFPNLSDWSTAGGRLAGTLAILFAIVMSVLLIVARNAPRHWLRLTASISAGAILMLGCLVSVYVLFMISYSEIPSPAAGFPFQWMLVLAEAFAVIFETLVIYWLGKRQLALPLTFFLVLAANAASFGAGLLLYSPYVFRI